jgi:hypothetical protein
LNTLDPDAQRNIALDATTNSWVSYWRVRQLLSTWPSYL